MNCIGLSSNTAVSINAGLSYNTWNHIAIVKYNNIISIFVNGQQKATNIGIGTLSGALTLTNGHGFCLNGHKISDCNGQGYYCNIRMSSCARYISNFITPIKAFTPYKL